MRGRLSCSIDSARRSAPAITAAVRNRPIAEINGRMGSNSLKEECFRLFGKKSGGVLYGQHTRLLHLMRTHLIYVSHIEKEVMS